MWKMTILCLVLLLCAMLSSCGESTDIQPNNIGEPVMSMPKKNTVQGVAFEFQTNAGEYITVIQDTEHDIAYKVPTDILDARLLSTPIQICSGDYVIDVGYASGDVGASINDNLYGVIYDAVIQAYFKKTDGEVSDKLKALLLDYDSAYPNQVYRDENTFVGADNKTSVWSDSVVDLSKFTKMEPFHLPIVTCTYQLQSGEYLVAHCYATIQSGLWCIDDIPAYLDVASSDTYKDARNDDYAEYITKMHNAYNECVRLLQEELAYINVGDLSQQYTIVSLSNTTNNNYTYGVDVSVYDSYAFVVLSDSSVYLAYENNGVRAVECIAGDESHNLSPNWDKYDTKIVDLDTGEEYPFTWKTTQ